jgi:hypothetical protein
MIKCRSGARGCRVAGASRAAAPMEIWEGIERKIGKEARKKNGDIEEEEGAQPSSNKFLHPPLIKCYS